jgi:tRNA pseudouridine(38-40) synthase
MSSKSKRIVLGVQYDGAPWQGWQTQPSGLTVQDTLERALREFTGSDIATTCAGRTDAGVHALEQVVHFDTDLDREMTSWVRGVNTFLPPSIAVRWAYRRRRARAGTGRAFRHRSRSRDDVLGARREYLSAAVDRGALGGHSAA